MSLSRYSKVNFADASKLRIDKITMVFVERNVPSLDIDYICQYSGI